MSYLVPPGLYAIGSPGTDSPVIVTANYKMSYDIVRRELAGRNVWLLVLETYGINVWCAAGKGTFGTGEVVRRVKATGLALIVSHRQLILPILGAPGVKALEVKQRTGFSVRFATIRAADLPEYLDNGMVTTTAMGELTFSAYERFVLTPMELVIACRWSLIVTVFLLLFWQLSGSGWRGALPAVGVFAGAVACGAFLAPVLLPWLPGRSFALKGGFLGLLWVCLWSNLFLPATWSWHDVAVLLLILPATSAFLTLNFTGSTPFTSRSGVKKEMRIALPVIGGSVFAAFSFWLAGCFI